MTLEAIVLVGGLVLLNGLLLGYMLCSWRLFLKHESEMKKAQELANKNVNSFVKGHNELQEAIGRLQDKTNAHEIRLGVQGVGRQTPKVPGQR